MPIMLNAVANSCWVGREAFDAGWPCMGLVGFGLGWEEGWFELDAPEGGRWLFIPGLRWFIPEAEEEEDVEWPIPPAEEDEPISPFADMPLFPPSCIPIPFMSC